MSAVYPSSVVVEYYDADWFELPDILNVPGITINYGINGIGPLDRVADTGTMTFEMDNSAHNSERLAGLWSLPGNPEYFIGLPIRLAITYDGVTYYKWRGTIASMVPVAGAHRARRVRVTCTDWMDEAARSSVRIGLETNSRSDELFELLIAAVDRQPGATESGYGMETFAYAFDRALVEGLPVMTELQRLALSELGYVYLKGDTEQGGTLVFEDRRKRGVRSTNDMDFDADPDAPFHPDGALSDLSVSSDRDLVHNRIQIRLTPRRIDATSGEFSPIDLAPTLWLDADELEDSDGDTVELWDDQSGNGYNLTGSGATAPTLHYNARNGHKVVRFAGDQMSGSTALSSLITNSAATIFVVHKFTSGTNNRAVFSTTTGNIIRLTYEDSGAIDGKVLHYENNDGSADVTDQTIPSVGDWYISTWYHSGGVLYATLNDTATLGTGATSGNTTPLTSFLKLGNNAADTHPFYGDIAELIIYNSALSEANRKNVESYLSLKYDITVPYELTGLGSGEVVLFGLNTADGSVAPAIPRNTSLTLEAPFRDPDQTGTRVGGTGLITPEETTDYLFNTESDGEGSNITPQISITVDSEGANSQVLTITNDGPQDGYLTFLQLRGRGVYSDEGIIVSAANTDTITTYGENLLNFEMPYQSSPSLGTDAANYLLNVGEAGGINRATGLTFVANNSDFLMRHALGREISDRVGITETLTHPHDNFWQLDEVGYTELGETTVLPYGIDSSARYYVPHDYFINAVSLNITQNNYMTVRWTLVPALADTYWILDEVGYSELDETTKLAYGFLTALWLLDLSSLNIDTRVNP